MKIFFFLFTEIFEFLNQVKADNKDKYRMTENLVDFFGHIVVAS